MVCIYCGSKTHVTNSREQKRTHQVWRRRACQACNALFTTIEAPELTGGLVVQQSGISPVPFSRDKLFVSILQALGHRSDATEAGSALCSTIIGKLLGTHPGASVEARAIRNITHTTLSHFDSAGAVTYAAYHPNPSV